MTQTKRIQYTRTDGLSIACMKWGGHHDVRGVVQIAHGLGEHMGRYAELAEKLVDADFVVYGNDHRGHGLTAKPSGSFGEFGPGGFDQLVEDMISLRVIAKNEHPHKPYILLGTVWALLLHSSLFSTIVIQLAVWRFPVLAFWMAWRALRSRCLRER